MMISAASTSSVAILLMLCLCVSLAGAETVTKSNVDADKQATASERADALIKELAAQRLDLDDACKADLALIDLLTRKAEAYALVEQPVDAGRMLAEAQAKIAIYQDDQRSQLRDILKDYSARLFVIAQTVLAHTATLDLEDKQADPAKTQATAPSSKDTVKQAADPVPAPNKTEANDTKTDKK